MRDRNTIGKRALRYARVTTGMARAGARVAGARLKGESAARQQAAVALRQALGGLKGPLMKVAQILSTIPDAVPPEYAAELAQLQANAPSMGWPFVKRRMAAELGAGWEKKFAAFSQTAFAAASLGQVHAAKTHDGQDVVCKLQYPDMQAAVAADLQQLKLFFSVFEKIDRAVSTKKVQEEIAERLAEELDYHREAKNIGMYQDILAQTAGVHVPTVVPSLSTARLLTMTRLDGARFIDAAADRRAKDRNAIAINMFHAWYVPFYGHGIIHGDPHMGNYTVRDDHSINLLDFGCVRIFPPDLVAGVLELYHALRTDDDDRAAEAYRAWGFKNPSKKLIEVLNIWAHFVYAPLLEDRVRSIEETNTGLYGREVANRVHRELRALGGGVVVPREFVFMDRAAVGLGSVFLRLRAAVNWYRLFHQLVEDFDVTALQRRQTKLLKAHGISAS